ncbi:hypothetical protein SLS58_006584 [Diplodia intermedia]|uniref:Uncharacterized protein n=1 Tax=Diplodia intermedia TaxID=856260 RepID=A0ABR3TMB6_9PEZI
MAGSNDSAQQHNPQDSTNSADLPQQTLGTSNTIGQETDDDDETVGSAPLSSREALRVENIQPAIKAGNKYAKLLAVSYHDMLRAVWEDERNERRALKNIELAQWLHITLPIMATMTGPILNEIICGNIAYAAKHDQTIGDIMKFYQANAPQRPAIYNVVLVDEYGNSPTPNELDKVLDILEKYPERDYDELAEKIDGLIHAPSLSTDPAKRPLTHSRRYLRTANNHMYSIERLVNLKTFCKSLKHRFEGMTSLDRLLPLDHPLGLFGWSIDADARKSHHLSHQSSNYIMNLTEAVCQHLYENDVLFMQYRMQAYPICFLAEPEQSIAAELLFTCIGDGYIHAGGGFSHHNAGENNDSANKLPATVWDAQARFVLKNTPFRDNVDKELLAYKEEYAERQQLIASINRSRDIIKRLPETEARWEAIMIRYEIKLEELLQMLRYGLNWRNEGRLPDHVQATLDRALQEFRDYDPDDEDQSNMEFATG